MAIIKVKTGGVDSTTNLGRRNLIINGAMQVAQRGTSGSIASGAVNPNYASVDRFKTEAYDADQFVGTWEQVTDAPAGFSYSAKWTTTTAETAIDASELFDIRHVIEAQDVAHLEYGSSDAKTCTLSFWVKSSVTGTFTVNVYNMDSSRQLPIEYTITAANTWEKKILTVVGDTGGSNFANDNGPGLQFTWNLAAGSDYSGTAVTGSWAAYSGPAWAGANQSNDVGTTLNATWQLTGVQFEVGDTATPFEHRSYAEELQACKRYYEKIGNWGNTNGYYQMVVYRSRGLSMGFQIQYTVEKRVDNPSVTWYSPDETTTGSIYRVSDGGASSIAIQYGPSGNRHGVYRTQHSSNPASPVDSGYSAKLTVECEL